MGREIKQMLFQRGNADGQQAHEKKKKVLNIDNHLGNANQNHKISPDTCQNGYNPKEHK